MQQNNNNNNVIANELNSIVLSLVDIKTESIGESLEIVESKISQLEHLSHDMNIPELRALTHWMMLNTELDNDNETQISNLIEDGSYYNWMEVLSTLLQDYDQTLLPIIYKTLTEPKWIVKPSAPLLRNLASWIDTARLSSKKVAEVVNDDLLINDTTVDIESSIDIDDLSNDHIFEEVDSTLLEKNYDDIGTLKHFSDDTEDNKAELTTEETPNYYDDIEEEIIIDPTEELFAAPLDESLNFVDKGFEVEIIKEEKLEIDVDVDVDNISLDETVVDITSNNSVLNEESDDFSMEVDDIIMSLATITAVSENTFDNIESYISELQRFDMLAEISGYEKLIPISNWCQKNITLFADNQSNKLQHFISGGECWTWIELIKLSIVDPEEISIISELNLELSREEWLEPLAAEDLQSLLLFLHNPQNNTDSSSNTLTDESIVSESDEVTTLNNDEFPDLSFNWDEDVHPELLEVYFIETDENIAEISAYLKEIGSVETTKEQRQDARRTAHTIKGGSAVVGITALSTYAYQLEKILDYAIENTLPNESNELLHTVSTSFESFYNSIKDEKNIPIEFSTTLSNLILCAETLDKLDDGQPLELSSPVLPDFIKQQNETNSGDALLNEEIAFIDNSIEIESLEIKQINDDVTENYDSEDTDIIADENIVNESIDNEDIVSDIIETPVKMQIEQELEDGDTVLPTLNHRDDISDFTAELDDIVMTLITTKVQITKKPFKLDAYIEELQRLDMLAEISGYPEIITVNNWYQRNLKLMAKKGTKKIGKFISSGESWAWVELVSAALADPSDISYLSDLSTELTRTEWIEALDIEELQALLLALRAVENTPEEAQDKDTVIIENELDNSDKNIITWDDDVHPELLSVYLQETSEQVTKIAELLHLISKGKADKDQQEHAARIAHTIKGASGVVGITEIVDFTHKLEDILDYAVNHDIPDETAELLAESSDCLESLFEAVQDKAVVPEEFEPVLAKLTAYAKSIESEDNVLGSPVELEMPELPAFITKTEPDLINESTDSKNSVKVDVEEVINETETIETFVVKPDSTSTTDSHIRVPTTLINKLLNLAGELVTTSSQVSDKIEKTLETSQQIKTQDKRVHDMLDELSSTIYKQEKDQITMLSSMQNKDFDSLEMDTYNELHSVAGLLTESILDSETIENTLNTQLNEVHDDLRLLDNLNKELSETILSSRMESLNTLIPRLERIVRQTCRKTNKEAELIVTGKDINIDTEILSGLVDPLLHLLRNAIDHGIETPKARKSKKKNQTGQIKLNFSRQGNFIHMKLTDDGAGIDSEKIYQHAINKGLITPEQEYSESEVLKLILEPGFSTQTNVTDISGRGVGMDVVNKGIEALKGFLTITSELGEGTSFNVKIPLTLVTSSTLLVETAGNKVAIPTDSIEQLYYLSPDDVLNRKDNKFIRHEGKELVIESLAGILGWTTSDVDFTKAQTLLLVKGSQRLHAVYIDQIIHSREIVIKSLAHFIDGTKGVIGACHLSDGEVAPVMNLPQLLSLNEQPSYIVKQLDESNIEVTTTNQTPQILVVDDSLSNRKALSLIINKTEYDVITAVDGLDALNVMNEKHIDLVFTDLEMPRMTGLELTQAIRAWDGKKEIPIVMITSRSTNKHRELAKKAGVDDYLTKPVGTDTLLESMETWLKQPVEA